MELTVGKFASAVHTTVRTLRYYEKMGLLVPLKKNASNQKIYTRDEIKKQLLKSMGWPLNEIKQMLEESAYSFREMVEMQEAMLIDKFWIIYIPQYKGVYLAYGLVFLNGLLFAFLFYWTDSLIPSIIAHAIYNLGIGIYFRRTALYNKSPV